MRGIGVSVQEADADRGDTLPPEKLRSRADAGFIERAQLLTEKIEAAINNLKAQAGTAAGLKTGTAEVTAAIDEADHAFDNRYQAINSFGQGQPPGQPMFS